MSSVPLHLSLAAHMPAQSPGVHSVPQVVVSWRLQGVRDVLRHLVLGSRDVVAGGGQPSQREVPDSVPAVKTDLQNWGVFWDDQLGIS